MPRWHLDAKAGPADPGAGSMVYDITDSWLSVSHVDADGVDRAAWLAQLVATEGLCATRLTDRTWEAVQIFNGSPPGLVGWARLQVIRLGANPPWQAGDLIDLVELPPPGPPAAHTIYATVDDLAAALRIRVTTENRALLQACLEAAAAEIDLDLDRTTPLPDPPPAAVARCNVNRAVEWFKAADAAYGIVGFEQTGLIYAPKDGFARHAATITAFKQRWAFA